MLAGLAVALVYLVGARYFAVPFYEWTAALSNAGAEGLTSFADLKDAWIAATPGADREAAWTVLQAQARDNANWWGVDGLAVALLALPVGFVALVLMSLITPAPRPGSEPRSRPPPAPGPRPAQPHAVGMARGRRDAGR